MTYDLIHNLFYDIQKSRITQKKDKKQTQFLFE